MVWRFTVEHAGGGDCRDQPTLAGTFDIHPESQFLTLCSGMIRHVIFRDALYLHHQAEELSSEIGISPPSWKEFHSTASSSESQFGM
jgi:hypothetical protein